MLRSASYHSLARSKRIKMSLIDQSRKVFRPLIDDVERLSKGDAARKRGTGSRLVPHRLNSDERKMYELAKKNDYLMLKGTGYRKERKGSPLANIWRQWCDAKAMPCIVLVAMKPEQKIVMVDLSTLRRRDCISNVRPRVVEFVHSQKGVEVDSEILSQYMPFTIIDVEVSKWYTDEDFKLHKTDDDTNPQESSNDLKIKVVTQKQEVDYQAEKVRKLKKEDGLTNQDAQVKQEVKLLLEQKEILKQLETQFQKALEMESKNSYQNESIEIEDEQGQQFQDDSKHPMYTHAIWQIPAYLLGFEGGEQSERQLAEAIVKWVK